MTDEPNGADRPGLPRRMGAALILAIILTGIDVNIVNTALPSIAARLGGGGIGWIVTAFMLGSASATPLYGKLSDVYGRRPLFLIATGMFLLGSLACAAASSIVQLALARSIQGLGAGGMVVLASIVVADFVPPRRRSHYQSLFMGAYAGANLIGPLTGGLITQVLGWRWIFLLNLPLGLIVLVQLAAHLPRGAIRARAPIDYLGLVLLTATATAAMLLLTLLGDARAGANRLLLPLAVAAAAMLPALIMVERRAADPILPPALFALPAWRRCLATSALIAFPFFGAAVFLPLYLQVVRGLGPAASGLALVPQMIGLALSSAIAARLIERTGAYGWCALAGVTLTALGLGLIGLAAWLDAGLLAIELALLVLGLGGGMVRPNLIVALQHSLPQAHVGTGTAALGFVHLLAGSAGVTAAGALVSAIAGGRIAGLDASYGGAITALFFCGAGIAALSTVPAYRIARADRP